MNLCTRYLRSSSLGKRGAILPLAALCCILASGCEQNPLRPTPIVRTITITKKTSVNVGVPFVGPVYPYPIYPTPVIVRPAPVVIVRPSTVTPCPPAHPHVDHPAHPHSPHHEHE